MDLYAIMAQIILLFLMAQELTFFFANKYNV